jgi:hypothetical protein
MLQEPRHLAEERTTALFPSDGRFYQSCPWELTVLEFISFGAHIGSEYGGADMPLTGPIPEGRTFFCPHCGALYSVTYSRLSKSDSNIAKCVVCLQIMTSWDSTKVPIYKLVQRPEDA